MFVFMFVSNVGAKTVLAALVFFFCVDQGTVESVFT